MSNVNHLDTINFDSTITAYEGYIRQFLDIVKSVNDICDAVIDESCWKGNGRNAFKEDYRQVQCNLQDIADIMYEIRDALTNANVKYMKTDESLAKNYTS